MTKIVTQLDKPAVVTALRELAPANHNAKLFRSTFEGQIDQRRISVGYRFGWFVPPIRLVTFTGRLLENGDGTEIEGEIGPGWIFYLLAAWLFVVTLLSTYRAASGGDYAAVGWVAATAAFLLFLGGVFVRTTKNYVVNEIGRAVRGKVSDD